MMVNVVVAVVVVTVEVDVIEDVTKRLVKNLGSLGAKGIRSPLFKAEDETTAGSTKSAGLSSSTGALGLIHVISSASSCSGAPISMALRFFFLAHPPPVSPPAAVV